MDNKSFPKIWIVIVLVVFVAGGILVWQNWFSKISPEKLEEFAFPQNGEEFAFIQNGDIWLMGKDFESNKVIDTKEVIRDFAISPDGKETYWINEKQELWERDYEGNIKLLGSELGEFGEFSLSPDGKEIYWVNDKDELWKKDYEGIIKLLEDRVIDFFLSPDGKFIAYYFKSEEHRFEGRTIDIHPKLLTSMLEGWIMKNDGSQKVKIGRPIGEEGYLVRFQKWFPCSKKILITYQYSGQFLRGDLFYEVGIDGKNPKVSLITGYDGGYNLYDTRPFFSPDGTRAVLFIAFQRKPGIWLVNIDGSDRKILLEGTLWGGGAIDKRLSWSEDGTLLAVSTYTEVFIFDRRGNLISRFEIIEHGISYMMFSSDNKYLVGLYGHQIEGEKFERAFLINISTKEIKKFQFPKLENVPAEFSYSSFPQFLSKKGNLLYYSIFFRQKKITNIPTPPSQFWVLDFDSGKNYKILDGAWPIIKMP